MRTLRPAVMAWWRIARPTVMGVSAMVENEAGHILLVRHTYTSGWHFPGGGVKTRETVADALARELREEVGVALKAAPELVGVYTNLADPRSSHVAFYRVRSFDIAPAPNLEIAEQRFFAPDALPPGVGRGPVNRLAEMRGGRAPDGLWRGWADKRKRRAGRGVSSCIADARIRRDPSRTPRSSRRDRRSWASSPRSNAR